MSGVVIVAQQAFTRACLGMALAPAMRERPVLYSGPSAEDAVRSATYLPGVAAGVDVDPAPEGGATAAVRALASAGFAVTAITGSATDRDLLIGVGATTVLAKSAIGLDDVANAVLGQGSVDAKDIRAPHVTVPLSTVQRRVLALFATGSSCNEIARELGVSPETVKTHLKRVRLKYREHGIHLPARSDIYRAARMSGVVA